MVNNKMEEMKMNTEQKQGTLFEVAITRTKESMNEMVDLIYLKRMYRWYIISCASILLFSIGAKAARYGSLGLVVSSIVIPIMIVCTLVTRHRTIKSIIKNTQTLDYAKAPEPKRFYADSLIIDDYKFTYDQIKNIIIGKVSIYLLGENVFSVGFRKDAFTIGDYASFIDFLIEKLHDKPKIVKVLEKEKKKLS